MDEIIVADGLVKQFDAVMAVADISFCVRRGEMLGFLGPNGAGKTTTINMLTGLARPDAGAIHIAGVDCAANPKAAQYHIGVVPDESNLYPELTGFENLCFCAALYGMPKQVRQQRARELLTTFGLVKASDRKFGGYSKGMKRKLTIAAGIIHRPKILFLDEPTMGLDVSGARQLRQLIADLHGAGTTIFLTTHYIEEAERLCDRVAFIVSGRIVKTGSIPELLAPIQGKHGMLLVCDGHDTEATQTLAEAFPEMTFTRQDKDTLRVEADSPILVGPLARSLEAHHVEILEARRVRPSLEDVFVDITGIEAKAMSDKR